MAANANAPLMPRNTSSSSKASELFACLFDNHASRSPYHQGIFSVSAPIQSAFHQRARSNPSSGRMLEDLTSTSVPISTTSDMNLPGASAFDDRAMLTTSAPTSGLNVYDTQSSNSLSIDTSIPTTSAIAGDGSFTDHFFRSGSHIGSPVAIGYTVQALLSIGAPRGDPSNPKVSSRHITQKNILLAHSSLQYCGSISVAEEDDTGLSLTKALGKALLKIDSSSTDSAPLPLRDAVALILLIEDRPLTFEEVIACVIATFPFYAMAASHAMLQNNYWKAQRDFRVAYMTALRQFDMQVSIHGNLIYEEIRYAMDAASGRSMFRHLLPLVGSGGYAQKDSSKPSRFMGLPPEIRLLIYEMVLRFPESGCLMATSIPSEHGRTTDSGDKTEKPRIVLQLVTRNMKAIHPVRAFLDVTETSFYDVFALESLPLKDLLGLLHVNKHIRREACDIFSSINKFIFIYPSDVHLFLRHMVPFHLGAVKRIGILLELWERDEWNQALQLLTDSLPKLDHVTVSFGQEDWDTFMDDDDETEPYATVDSLPGVQGLCDLVKLRAVKVLVMEGHCDDQIEHFIEVMEPCHESGLRLMVNGVEKKVIKPAVSEHREDDTKKSGRERTDR